MNVQKTPKVAIVHDWLTVSAGAEKVLFNILQIWPGADLFSLVDFMPDHSRGIIFYKSVKTSFLQDLPFAKTKFRWYLPLMPIAIEQFDLSDYDLIISSSFAVAKGVITGPDQLHVCYCHSPIRYAWDMQFQYLKESGINSGFIGILARLVLHYLRNWDFRSAGGVDVFVANSKFVSRRINKFYRRDSVVLNPPVDIKRFRGAVPKSDFYLTASRLVPYKRIDLIVKAFSAMPEKILYIVGDGPEFHRLKQICTDNVIMLGYCSDVDLTEYLKKARAFVFAAEEDFGIAPIEAQASGTPVIAYGKGGALETVVEDADPLIRTGLFFHAQDADSIVEAVHKFDSSGPWLEEPCRLNAERFSEESFKSRIVEIVNLAINDKLNYY